MFMYTFDLQRNCGVNFNFKLLIPSKYVNLIVVRSGGIPDAVIGVGKILISN